MEQQFFTAVGRIGRNNSWNGQHFSTPATSEKSSNALSNNSSNT
jgi:hypothetical protein